MIFVHIGIQALGAGHGLVRAGGAQRSAHFTPKEPVQHRNQHHDYHQGDEDRVLEGKLSDVAGGNDQLVFADVDRLVGLAAHDNQVDRIQRQLGQNAGQDSRDAHGRMEQARHQTCQHTGNDGAQKGNPHVHACHH